MLVQVLSDGFRFLYLLGVTVIIIIIIYYYYW